MTSLVDVYYTVGVQPPYLTEMKNKIDVVDLKCLTERVDTLSVNTTSGGLSSVY